MLSTLKYCLTRGLFSPSHRFKIGLPSCGMCCPVYIKQYLKKKEKTSPDESIIIGIPKGHVCYPVCGKLYLKCRPTSEADPRCPEPPPPPLKFEKCPFYLGFFVFLQIYLGFFIMLWCPFYHGPPPPPPIRKVGSAPVPC